LIVSDRERLGGQFESSVVLLPGQRDTFADLVTVWKTEEKHITTCGQPFTLALGGSVGTMSVFFEDMHSFLDIFVFHERRVFEEECCVSDGHCVDDRENSLLSPFQESPAADYLVE